MRRDEPNSPGAADAWAVAGRSRIWTRTYGIIARRESAPAILGLILGFVALAWFLWPITWTWYLGDDPFIAFDPDTVAQRGDSTFGFMVDEIQRAAEQLGRSSPLATFAIYTAFWVTPSVGVFKLGVVAVALLAAALGSTLLCQLGFSWPYAALFPVTLCGIVQLRYWHDPLLAYAASMPVVSCLVLGSLVAFAAALRRDSRVCMHLPSSSSGLVACTTRGHRRSCRPSFRWPGRSAVEALRAVVRRSAPHIVVAGAFVLLIFVMRAAAPGDSTTAELYQPNLSPRAIASGLAKQVSGSVPLSYVVAVARFSPDGSAASLPEDSGSTYGSASAGLAVPPGLVTSEWSVVIDGLSGAHGAVLCVLVLAALAALVPARRTAVPRRSVLAAGAVGAVLIVGAALPLAVSTRWQRETFYGVPYIAVFVGYLGVAMLGLAALAFVLRMLTRPRAANAVVVAVAALVIVTAAVTNAFNERVVEAFGGVKAVMELNEDALHAGLLRSSGHADEILLGQDVPLSASFLSVAGGVPAPPTQALASFDGSLEACGASTDCLAPGRRLAYLSRLDGRGMPWVLVCALDRRASLRAEAAACSGKVAVAAGGERFPHERCSHLLLDGGDAPPARGRQALPVRLTAVAAPSRDVLACGATLKGPVLTRSLTVAPPRPASAGPLVLTTTSPARARVGEGFNVQPNGQSAIAVLGAGVTPTTRIVMDGVDLASHYIDSSMITALVPPQLIARPGQERIWLRDGGVRSNVVLLTLYP